MKKYIPMIGVIVFLLVSVVFSQMTIITQRRTIGTQTDIISTQNKEIEALKNGMKDVVANQIETEITLCETIDEYREKFGLSNEHYAEKMRKIRDDFPQLKPRGK